MPKIENVLEPAAVAAKALQTMCEFPMLNFLGPAAAVFVLICETAKTVNDNEDAATDLIHRCADVLNLIVDHLQLMSPTSIAAGLERDALRLKCTLEEVHRQVKKLKDPKKKVYAWVWANQDKDNISKLKGQLSDALDNFGIARNLAIERKVDRVQDTVLDTNHNIKLVLDGMRSSPPDQPEPEQQRPCPLCGKVMRYFRGKKDGRPWVKCDDCDIVRDPLIPFCDCGLNAKEFTSHTEKNPDRRFLRCPKRREIQCNFFKWVSDN